MQLNEQWQWVIALLAFFIMLSLSLNIIIIKYLVNAKEQLNAAIFDIDTFPSFFAAQLYTNQSIRTDINTPSALVFLATNCPKCKSKIPVLELLALNAEKQGVSLRIIVHEHMKNITSFFNHTELKKYIWLLDYTDYKVINPREVSPSYIFVNELNEVEGQGMIDDDNWDYFKHQILGEDR